MAVTDTYNGDLVRIRQKIPAEGSDLTVEITECQEQATGYIDLQISKMGQTPSLTASYVDDMLKTIEAMIGAGLLAEQHILPDDDKDFGRKSLMRRTGEEWLRDWLDNKFGSEGSNAEDFIVHQKVARPAYIHAGEDSDDRDVI